MDLPVGESRGEQDGTPATGRGPRAARMRVRRPLSRHPVTTVPSPPPRSRNPGGADSDPRAVLRIPEFRRMWIQLSLSSLGDWMGLLATTALVTQLTNSFSGQAYAIGTLLIVRLMPALILGPLAGALADRLDRRMTMVVTDVMRFGLFVSIPLVDTLEWLLIASFLVECVTLVWAPAKEASIPHLVPRNRLAAANTLSLITTYGTAPLAAAIFALLATLSRAFESSSSFFRDSSLDLALYFNAATFLGSAIVIWGLRSIGRAERPEHSAEPGFFASITEGWKFVGQDRLVRGLVVGILGGFAGAGCVVALGRLYVEILGGGDSAYGVLFGAVFVGLAAGMAAGPKLLGDYSRTRLFGVCVTGAGITLVIVAIIPNLVIACILVVMVGAFAGVAWVTGYTLLQAEVADELRGRTFALVQSLVRVDLLLVLAAAPALVGLIGSHEIHLWGDIDVRADGVTAVLLGGGLLAVAVGLFSYRQMDDRTGAAVLPELWNAVRGRRPGTARPRHAGLFVAVEGGEGAGKTTQIELLRSWLASTGREVVVTRESGGTAIGAGLRELLLDPSTRLHARTETLLNAADRAEHVARVIEPALARGAIVLTDRYVDSSVAYQRAGRQIGKEELAVLTQWATHSLLPDITFLLDLPAELGLARAAPGHAPTAASSPATAAAPPRTDAPRPAVSAEEPVATEPFPAEPIPIAAYADEAPADEPVVDEPTPAGVLADTVIADEPVPAGVFAGAAQAVVDTAELDTVVTDPGETVPDRTRTSLTRTGSPGGGTLESSPPQTSPAGRTAVAVEERQPAVKDREPAVKDRESAVQGPDARDGADPDLAGVDADALAYHRRVREGFRRLADEDPGRYVTLDATLSPQELHGRIRSAIAARLRAGSADLASA